MQFKSIHLKNIRSYSSFDLDFQSGSTLLSGDIGCGKTTILLSIEFALFGLMKGMLSGPALLRHGTKDGSVELSFSTGADNYTIFRSLKKTSAGIVQDSGYLEINGNRKEYTAVELKQRILAVLGYPDELLTKSKSLIYRYTVYTPQEEMKKIIFDSEDERTEKLTKIFNVEKYKRIKENAENYAKELRAETRILPALESEMNSLKDSHFRLEAQMEEKNILLQKALSEVESEEKLLKLAEEKMKSMQEAVSAMATLKQEMGILAVEKTNLLRNREQARNDILSLEEQRKRMLAELSAEPAAPVQARIIDEISGDISKYKELREKNDAQTSDAKGKIYSINKKIEEHEKLKKDISSLIKCPTCQLDVNDEHKDHIAKDADNKIAELKEKKAAIDAVLEKCEKNRKIILSKLEQFEKEMMDARSREQKSRLRQSQESIARDAEQKIIQIKDRLKRYDEDLLSNEETLSKIKLKAAEQQITEDEIAKANNEYKKAKERHLQAKIKEAETAQSIKENAKALETSTSLQSAKKAQTDKIIAKKNLEHWLTNHFLSLVEVIEKNVMSSIRGEFKEHFEEWFNMLIEDESITATLDEKFNPVVSQNGYDTDLENLSGGEKTSVALAYRLALNKVINSMMSSIKTKDLLILDEPTDGFSSHQLDRVRDVLEALNSKQTIIVSHESKMESYVDHVIRLHKAEHKSSLL